MFEFRDFEDEQMVMPRKNTVSKFCSKNSQTKGILKKPINHIVNNPTEQICRKIDFDNDQETITVFPETLVIPQKNLLHVPDLDELVIDYKQRGFMNFNASDNQIAKCQGSKFAIKSSSVFQSNNPSNSGQRTPLEPISNDSFKHTFFTQNKFNAQSSPKRSKITFTNKQTTPNDKNTLQNDLTENDTYINNIIKQTSLLDLTDLDDDTPNTNFFPKKPKTSAFHSNNQNTSDNKRESLLSSSPNFLFDDDTTNKSFVVLPKKKKAKQQEENSIDTMYINQAISKQPIRPLFNPDDTTTNISFKNLNFAKHDQNQVEQSEEENEITKADIDEAFESEHSVILPISNRFETKMNGSFLNASKDELIIPSVQNEIDSMDLEHTLYGISKLQFNELKSNISSQYENFQRLYSQISNCTQHASQMFDLHPKEASLLTSFYALKGTEEILRKIYDYQETIQMQKMKSMTILENCKKEAEEELQRPKSSWNDFQATIQRLKAMQNAKQSNENDFEYYQDKYHKLESIVPFKVNSIHSNQINKPIVKFTNGRKPTTCQMENATQLHVFAAKNQRARKKKEEMISLMSLVPGFFFDGKIFSCLISSDNPDENKLFRFALIIEIPSFYPWCYLSINDNSIRSDFGIPKEEIKARIENILKHQKLSPHPLTDLIQAIRAEFL